MKAIDIIRNFGARGIVISLTADGESLNITRFSELTEDEKHYLKCYKTELLWRLRHLDADPDPEPPEWLRPGRGPHINEAGDLVIPLDCDPKYRWWQGGQSRAETLAEVQRENDDIKLASESPLRLASITTEFERNQELELNKEHFQ